MKRPGRTAVVATVYAGVLWAPAFISPEATGFGDWQMVHHNLEAALASVRAGDAPFWDPFHCGGVTSLGNPESQHFAPWILLLSLAMGSTLATKVLLVAHTALGAAGAFYYARRRHGLSVVAGCLVAAAWSGSGFFSWQLAGGHFTFAPYYLLPWLLLAWRRALSDARFVAPTALLIGVMMFEGGTYPVPHALLALLFETLALLGGARQEPGGRVAPSLTTALRNGAVAALLTVVLTAFRWVPITETLALFPRTVTSTDTPTLATLVSSWLEWEGDWRSPERLYVWPEYAAFMGAPVVVFAILGIPIALRRHRIVLLGLVVFLALAMGSFHPWAPWALLHELPVFDSLRVPSRLQVLITFYLALLAGCGADALIAFLSERLGHADWWTGATWGGVTLAVGLLVAFNLSNNARWEGAPLSEAQPPAPHFHLVPTPDYRNRYARLPRENRGTRSCYIGAMNWRVAPGLWTGDVPQARLAHGRLTYGHRTPGRIALGVEVREPTHLMINQNHHPGWRTNAGEILAADTPIARGRLAVALEPGTYDLRLQFEPAHWRTSLAASLVGLLACLVLWIGTLRRTGRNLLERRDA